MRKPIDSAAGAMMIALCLTWGLQQVAIKVIADEVSPLLQVAVRSGLASVLVLLVGKCVLRERWLPGVAGRSGVGVGLLFAAEFLCIAEGLRWTSASHMAVFLYSAPLFAALGLHMWVPEERLSLWQWLGMGLAFAGIAITFMGPVSTYTTVSEHTSPSSLVGDLWGLAAGVAWGMTTVVIRTSRLSEAPPTQTLFYQLLIASMVLLPIALVTGQVKFRPTAMALASLGFQTFAVSFASYLAWFWLLRKYLAARLGVFAFMTPLFGVTLGVVLLDEDLSRFFIAGAVIALVGVFVVNTSRRCYPNEGTGRARCDTPAPAAVQGDPRL